MNTVCQFKCKNVLTIFIMVIMIMVVIFFIIL